MRKAIWFDWLTAAVPALSLVLLAAGAMAVLSIADVRAAVAQAGDEEMLDEEEEVDADGAAVDTGDDEFSEGSAPTILGWAFQSLGAGYSLVFLSLSFTLVALFVMNLLTARRQQIVPVELVDGFEDLLNEKKYQDAFDLAKQDESFLGQVLSAGLVKLSAGYPQAIEAMQEVGEEENMKLEHRLSYMALIGTISPMIGLFGTVHGMILAFQVIATSPMQPKASELAEGIATALFTTLVGLFIAIPAIAAYNILRNQFARLVLEVGIVSEGLMSRFQAMGEKKDKN